MMKISTHLHLALKLSERMCIEDRNDFWLGNSYPTYLDMESFKVCKEKNDFNLGHIFRLWIDNRMMSVDFGEISMYDCMICDMPVIGPVIEELRQSEFSGKKAKAMSNILSLESEPMPLYLVPEEKKERYIRILDMLVEEFYMMYREKQLD